MTNVGMMTASAAGRSRVAFGWIANAIALSGAISALVACGPGLRAQNDHLASSEAIIRSAKDIDAQGDERTALLVQLAEEEVALAKNRMKDGETRRADLLLERAKSDAELAIMLTRENVAKAAAQKARQALDAKTARLYRVAGEE